jgi:membrane protease YdiL (CAAX protease family)
MSPAPAPAQVDGVLPPNGAEYPQILRGESYLWWRSILGATFGLSLFLLLTTVISRAVVMLAWATTSAGLDYQTYFTEATAFQRPAGMLGANLGIASLIPISWALIWVVHQVRPRWLASVQPRIRWRYLVGCVVVALVALNGALLLSTTVAGTPHIGLQHGFWGFLVVIVLTSPLQAAAEEIFFRGYLMQTLGSLVARPWFGVVVSSVVFALLHGVQNLPLFADRLAFGLLAALLVWKTGGLEAGIAAHVVNNICAYLIAGFTTSIATLKAIQGIGWVDAGFDVGGFALFAALAYGLSRLLKLRTRVSLTTG